MQFDFLTLEVDGSFRNPVVVFVVAVWAGVLAIASMAAAFAWYPSRATTPPSTRGRRVAVVVGVAFLYVATPIAQGILGNVVYAVQSHWDGGPAIISVGFWGGPPLWPAPVFGLVTAFIALWWVRRARAMRTSA